MNAEQQQAYDWAKSHDYSSVAAQYARVLATVVDSLRADLARVTAERDAAVGDLREVAECINCKHRIYNGGTCAGGRICAVGGKKKKWQWRGLKGEMQE